MNGLRTISLAIILAISTAACSASVPEPEIASSATESGYAQNHPAALQQIVQDFGRDDNDAGSLSSGFSGFTNELKDPDWSVVGDVYRSANDAGKSRAYYERNREVEGARSFFNAEQDEIVKKVGGSATYAVKSKGCDVELTGNVSHALSEAVAKRLEERLRERNEAHAIIERHRIELGKQNAAALETQADQISRASYLVHIAMVEEKVRLRALIEESEQIKKTIDDFIARERDFQRTAEKDEDKKASEQRIARANDAKASIEGSLSQAREFDQKIEDRIAKAQKRHQDAIDALLADVDKRAGKK